MKEIETKYEKIFFGDIPGIPDINVTISGCRFYPGGKFYDIADFLNKVIHRWYVPEVKIEGLLMTLRRDIPVCNMPLKQAHEAYYDNMMSSHVAQLSGSGKLFISLGNGNGPLVYVIDTKRHKAGIFPEDFDSEYMCYTGTGDFTPDNKYWLFIRWPLKDSVDILNGIKNEAACQIGRINLVNYENEMFYELDSPDFIHQITCSPDYRYLVFTTFRSFPNVPYPECSFEDDPDGYKKSHEAGIALEKMVTIDLEKKIHWRTEIPVPAPAHFEFDPVDPHVFYVSAHNFSWAGSYANVILEGPAALFKMRIKDGETVVEKKYSDGNFLRITQHMPFSYDGRTLIGVTNAPNYLDIIDADSMTLWRRVETYQAPSVDFTKTGNAPCPRHPDMCLNVNPSRDGRYIVLESHKYYRIYDLLEDRFLENTVPLYLPDKAGRVGHTRIACQ